MASKVYRHYGASFFDPTHKLGGGHMGKPNGLWASPKKSNEKSWTWKDFCEDQNYRLESLNRHFDFRLKKGTKILRIHHIHDILPYLENDDDYEEYSKIFPSLIAADPTKCKKLNMNKIHASFDGMEVYMGQSWNELYNTEMFWAYDVDSLVLWNLDRVVAI